MDRSTIPESTHRAGDIVSGFTIDAVTTLPGIKARCYEASHPRTGAKVVHVHCHDDENMFSVGFRTPPPDSTGVAHILEHSVLAGSKKYPVKDAFKELGKRTLNTFLNAMTWPDRTVYPVCSTVKADYWNLASVYVDLVFDPLLKPETFAQEGHHLELAKPGDATSDLVVTGVVYNEMKGAFSSPEMVVVRQLRRLLMPDTPYGHESGGDPEAIPDLSYDDFVRFHRQFYSPSNARFMFYGDVQLAENLAFLDAVLAPFPRVEVDTRLALQGRWTAPRRATVSYPVGASDPVTGKTFVAMAWLLCEASDVELSVALEVVLDALTGSAAAPLRKALVDSALGADVYPSGFGGEGRQSVAMIGLRGTEAERADRIEDLVMSTLRTVAREGLAAELIEASLHQIELSGREISSSFGLSLLVRANGPWYADADPKAGFELGAIIEAIRARYAADRRYFDTLIERMLIDNPHRLRLVGTPSRALAADRDARLAERLAAKKRAMDAAEVARVDAAAAALRAAQRAGDPPEALATLPTLAMSDIPRAAKSIPTDEQFRELGGVRVLAHPVFSNGLAYVGLAFDARDLDDAEQLLIPLLGRATTGMGAAGLDYVALSKRINRSTGGLSAASIAGRPLDGGPPVARFMLDGRALARNADELCAIMKDVLAAPDPRDERRLADLVREMASQVASRIVPSGHQFALYRAAASLTESSWRREQWSGVTQIQHLKRLAKDVAGGVGSLVERIAALQAKLFTRGRALLSVAGDPETLAAMRPALERLVGGLPAGAPAGPAVGAAPAIAKDAGVAIPAQVNYVAQVLTVPTLTSPAAPALGLLSTILSSDYLYRRLRVEGGAYGGFASYMADSGMLALMSYRDPHLADTLGVYAGVVEHLERTLDDAAVEASRIGAIGALDRVLSPASMLEVARSRHLFGVRLADRQAYRDGLMSLNAAQIRERALPWVARALADAPRAALGSREALDKANATLARGLAIESLE